MIATPTLQSVPRAAAAVVSASSPADSNAPASGARSADPGSFGAMLLRSTAPIAGVATALPTQPDSTNPTGTDIAEPTVANPSAYRFATTLVSSARAEPLAPVGSAPPTPGNAVPLPGTVPPSLFAKPATASATPAQRDAGKAASAPTDDAKLAEPSAVLLPDAGPLPFANPAFLLVPPASPLPRIGPAPSAAPALLANSPGPGAAGAGPGAAPAIPAQVSAPAADRATPIEAAPIQAPASAAGAFDHAVLAPLSRLAADAPSPADAVAVRIALPASAVAAAPSALPTPVMRQAFQRAAVEVSSPAEHQPAQPGDALPTAAAINPSAPAIAPVTAAQPHPSDSLAPTTGAVPAPDRVDFAALVDTITRAREQAAPQSLAAPVAVSLAHADFGPVALRFRHDGDALAVTMASADPGFAPAVAAATAADAGARVGQQQQADAQPRQHQPGSTPQQSSASPSGSANQGFAQAGQSETGQGQPDQRQPDQRQPGQNRSGGPVPTPRSVSRATDPGESDRDIFA